MKSPIFLFSLPRSGSTLLQRVLMSHQDIASVAEPWILLPYINSIKLEGTLSDYSHITSSNAINDFINNLPNKDMDYYELLGDFLQSLYTKQCSKHEKYFLDKTPRYYNIIPEINKIYPNAKFIFLFRNPLHILSSIIETWCVGELDGLYIYHRDLYHGPKLLAEGYSILKNKAFSLQYEEFIKNPKNHRKYVYIYCFLYYLVLLIKYSFDIP